MSRVTFGGLVDASLYAIMILLLCVLCSVTTCHAQAQAPAATSAAWGGPFNVGYIDDSARVMLEQTWDERSAIQIERGFCIEPSDVEIDTMPSRTQVDYHVRHLTLPDSTTEATPYAVGFYCSKTAISILHIHTPTTCRNEKNAPAPALSKYCRLGGPDSYLCSVDEWDQLMTRKGGMNFSIVQCDKHAFVFYFARRRG